MFAQGCFTLYSAHLPFAANVTCVDIGSNIYLSGNKKMQVFVLRIADLRTINISLHCCSLNFCFMQAGFWAIICLIRTYSFVLFLKNDIFKYSFVFIFATLWYVTHFPEQSLTSNNYKQLCALCIGYFCNDTKRTFEQTFSLWQPGPGCQDTYCNTITEIKQLSRFTLCSDRNPGQLYVLDTNIFGLFCKSLIFWIYSIPHC